MTEAELRTRIAAFRDTAPDPGMLAAAMLVAACDRPDFEPSAVHARLATLVAGASRHVTGHVHPRARVEALCFYLKDIVGLTGDDGRYYVRDNSCIDRVLATGCGIPITLAVIYAEVGGRLGLDCEGVNFPGHFLLRVRDQEAQGAALLIDPFAGRVVSHTDCQTFLQRVAGARECLGPQHLRSATGLDVLVRMLGNLKHVACVDEDWQGALRHSERIQLADPRQVMEFRDRALIHERLDDPVSASAEWQGLLGAIDDDTWRERIRARLERLERSRRDERIVH